MKNSILATALFLILSTGAFAGTLVDVKDGIGIENAFSINGLRTIGIAVSATASTTEKPFITITDMDGHKLYAEKLSLQPGAVRGYNLSELDNGDYMITINVGKQELKKQVHIYEDGGQKTYFIMQ